MTLFAARQRFGGGQDGGWLHLPHVDDGGAAPPAQASAGAGPPSFVMWVPPTSCPLPTAVLCRQLSTSPPFSTRYASTERHRNARDPAISAVLAIVNPPSSPRPCIGPEALLPPPLLELPNLRSQPDPPQPWTATRCLWRPSPSRTSTTYVVLPGSFSPVAVLEPPSVLASRDRHAANPCPAQDPSDPLSLLCAFLALVPQALCVVYATLIWSTREAEVALLFAGQLACEAANFALKRLIKEERPARIHGKGYGMPSSHAQFVAFWALSVALFLLVRHRPRGIASAARTTKPKAASAATLSRPADAAAAHSHATVFSFVERLLASAFALAVAAAVAWSRIYLNYHTTRQVLAGSLAGVVCAVGWFAVTAVLRQTGLLAWALDTPAAAWLRFRDLVVEEDPCQAGWEKWQDRKMAARKAGARKKGA